MSTLAALKKLRVASIKTPNGVIEVNQIEQKVPSLLSDLKGSSREAKHTSLKFLLSYLVFLNAEQRNQLISSLTDILKNDNVETKGYAAGLLEMLIDHDTIHKLAHDGGVIQHLAGMLGSSFQTKKWAYRALYKISTFKHTLVKLDYYGVLKHALSEIQKDPIQISSDTCLLLISSFAEDSFYAHQMMSNGCLPSLLAILRSATTAPPKLISPTLKAVRNLARHDDVRLRAVLQAGVVQLISAVIAKSPSLMFPNIQNDAALVLCELANTKDDTSQDLLVRAGIGDLLAVCLRLPSAEVKRNAIIAIERWMYGDDRMVLYAVEFFLALTNNDVQISPRIKDMLTGLKLAKSPSVQGPIAALVAEIKQRPDSTNMELAKLRAENQKLTSNLAAQESYAKKLESMVGKSTPQAANNTEATIDFSGISNLDELTKLEEKLTKQRHSVIQNMQDRLLCPVCFDKSRDCSLSPCGHTLCTACAQRILSLGTCHVCRERVTKLGKMYL